MQLPKTCYFCLALLSFKVIQPAYGAAPEDYAQCLLSKTQTAEQTTTVAEIREYCLAQHSTYSEEVDEVKDMGALSSRIYNERMQAFDPYVIIPHRMNYLLPVYTTNRINSAPYEQFEGASENLEDIEAKFQLSLKIPLNAHHILVSGDGLYFGFTVEAWWQVYASHISKPFRETNYRPELFYLMPLNWQPFNGHTGFAVGIEHQSNGSSSTLSRSWNRVYLGAMYEKDNFALTIRPWWRIKEDPAEYPGDPKGDDNPDIDDYMGHFELNAMYRWQGFEVNFMARQNFDTSKGAFETGFIFPLWGRLRGYTTLFTGYGDSLIDYNYSQTRVGLGVALTSFL